MKCVVLIFVLISCSVSLGHGGGLDAHGGHRQKGGGYHYHRGGGGSVAALQQSFGANFSGLVNTTEARTEARISASTTARTTSRGAATRDRKTFVPRAAPEKFLEYAEPEIPEHEILSHKESDGKTEYKIKIGYETGLPRPSETSLKRLTRDLAPDTTVDADFHLPDGVVSEEIWAKGAAAPAAVPTVQFMPYHTDYDVYGVFTLGVQKAVQVFVYPTGGKLPSRDELIRYADQSGSVKGQLVTFYLPTMNPEAPPWALYRVGNFSSFHFYPHRAPAAWQTSRAAGR